MDGIKDFGGLLDDLSTAALTFSAWLAPRKDEDLEPRNPEHLKLLSALLDAAHAYGLAAGREGFHRLGVSESVWAAVQERERAIWEALAPASKDDLLDHVFERDFRTFCAAAGRHGAFVKMLDDGEETAPEALPHPLTPGALRASIDTIGRAVDDCDRRVSRLEACDPVTRLEFNLLETGAVAAVARAVDRHEGRIAALADEVATLDNIVNGLKGWEWDALVERVKTLEETREGHVLALSRLNRIAGEPPWTKPDLDALLERVNALERGSFAAGLVQDANRGLSEALEERIREVERLRSILVNIQNLADFEPPF